MEEAGSKLVTIVDQVAADLRLLLAQLTVTRIAHSAPHRGETHRRRIKTEEKGKVVASI